MTKNNINFFRIRFEALNFVRVLSLLLIIYYSVATAYNPFQAISETLTNSSIESKTNESPDAIIPYVGIFTLPVTPAIAKALDLNEELEGFIVTNVDAHSPAENAGIRGGYYKTIVNNYPIYLGGDIIVAIDHKNVTKYDYKTHRILPDNKKVGDSLVLTVLRDNKLKDINITLIAPPQFYTYKNPEYGVEITVPYSMVYSEAFFDNPSNSRQQGIVCIQYNYSMPSLCIGEENLNNNFINSTESFNEYIKTNLGFDDSYYKNFKVIESTINNTNSEDIPLHKIVYTAIVNDTAVKGMEIRKILGNTSYVIVYEAEEDTFSDYWPTIQMMINSFKKTEPGISSFQDTQVANQSLADYTFMVYMIGSDLELVPSYAATKDILEMQSVGSNSKVNVIVETGGGSKNTTIDGKRFIDFTKVQRHKILHNNFQTIADLGQQNMGEPLTLSNFIVSSISEFPAKKYVIILWDHGSGINGFGGDLQFNNDKLDLEEIKKAFAGAKKITNKNFELIGLDSCMMSSIEVANNIKSYGNYMISSQEIIPPWGWNYSAILSSLTTDPHQNGSLLGTTIVDSFFKSSQIYSASQNFGADKLVTLSLIYLPKVELLIKDIDSLVFYLKNNITDIDSFVSFAKSVDLTERFGRGSKDSTGIVDLYDLTSNIRDKFPQTEKLVNAVQESLKNVVVYSKTGDANPKANGLSVYMPIRENEITSSLIYGLDSWQALINIPNYLIGSDAVAPSVQSFFDGETITGQTYDKDISNVTLYILLNSTKGYAIYSQNFDPSSFINADDGSFKFKWNRQILSLCNENKLCILTDVTFEFTKDKKFALIPVRLESNANIINKNVSLVYEINTKGEYVFLGASPEITAEETISKEKYPLYSTDKIYPLVSSDSNIEGEMHYIEDGPLQVLNPNTFHPEYITYNETSDLVLVVCDYSNNCSQTRTYHFDKTPEARKELNLQPFRYEIQTQNNGSHQGIQGNFTTYVYPFYKFKVQYPTNWTENTFIHDPWALQLIPPQSKSYVSSPGDIITFGIYADYSFMPVSLKQLVDAHDNYNKQSYRSYDVIESNETTFAGFPAYKTVYKGAWKETKIRPDFIATSIYTIIDNRQYIIIFMAPPSEFYNILPAVEKIIDSFDILTYGEITSLSSASGVNEKEATVTENDILSQNINATTGNFSRYVHPTYGYTIEYPSHWDIEERQSGLMVYFYPPVLLYDKQGHYQSTDEQISRLQIETIPNPSNPDLYFGATQYGNHIKKSAIGLSNFELNKTSISGNSAYIFSYNAFDVGTQQPSKYMDVLMSIDEKNYVIFHYFAHPKIYDMHLPTIQRMINSFEIWPLQILDPYISVQYPPDWQARTTDRGVHIIGPSGFGILIETFLPVGGIYPSAGTPMNDIAQLKIRANSQIGYTYLSSEIMGNQNNSLIKNMYQYQKDDNMYAIEYLAKRPSGILTVFRVAGTLDQIDKYTPYTIRVFQSVQLSPAFESQVRGMLNDMLNSMQQSILDTYGIAAESFGGMATDFAQTADEMSNYYSQQKCEERGFPGTTVCP